MIKTECCTPTTNECNEVQEKNNLWIMTKWNNPHNIGIKPIQDYIDSSMYPTITTNETITHERVTRVHHEMKSETIHE